MSEGHEKVFKSSLIEQKYRNIQNSRPGPCIVSGMELLQSKIPYMTPDWTLVRGAKYVVKLAAFILVPGLHQVSIGRRVFGVSLFVFYLVVRFALRNEPVEWDNRNFLPAVLFDRFVQIAEYTTWFLLALDWKNLDRRSLKPLLFFALPCAIAIFITLNQDRHVLFMHVETKNVVCPAFCKHDIIEWDHNVSKTEKISKGDYVVIEDGYKPYVTTRVLVDPVVQACAEDDRTELRLPINNMFCHRYLTPQGRGLSGGIASTVSRTGRIYIYYYEYLVAGRVGHTVFFPWNHALPRKISMVSKYDVIGVRPRKVGNIREYFIFTNDLSDLFGRGLLIIYKWTGINLFGLSK